jgi:hypothetical protein
MGCSESKDEVIEAVPIEREESEPEKPKPAPVV